MAEQLNASGGDMEDTLDTEETFESIVINSTKQPLPIKDCRPKKRQKREQQEDV